MSDTYRYRELLAQVRWKDVIPLLEGASDTMARVDELMGREGALATGVQSRGHFREACATAWLQGSLVHLEDLVLHDAAMDLRAPSSGLPLASMVLRARREICRRAPERNLLEVGWFNESAADLKAVEPQLGVSDRIGDDSSMPRREHLPEDKSYSAALQQTEMLAGERRSEEKIRFEEWLAVVRQTDELPALLAAAFAWDAWAVIKPMNRLDYLGLQWIAAILRARRKAKFHLPTLSVGIRVADFRQRPRDEVSARLAGFLAAAKAASETGLKDLSELSIAKQRMEARLKLVRSNSRLPDFVELFLTLPLVTVPVAAKYLKVSPQAVDAMIKTLGPALPREITGRTRYRAWGIF